MRLYLKDWFKINIIKYICDRYVYVCVGYNLIKNDFCFIKFINFLIKKD